MNNPEDELLGGAMAWGDGRNNRSRGSDASGGGSVRLMEKTRNKLVKIGAGGSGNGSSRGAYDDGGHYNDASLSRSQPWRSRYPTPQDLKEQLARSSASDD